MPKPTAATPSPDCSEPGRPLQPQQHSDHRVAVTGVRAVALAHPHAAQAKRRNLQSLAQHPGLHDVLLRLLRLPRPVRDRDLRHDEPMTSELVLTDPWWDLRGGVTSSSGNETPSPMSLPP